MRPTLLPFALLLLVPACARTETVRPAPPLAVTSAPVPPARRGLYRLDFVLTTKDAAGAAQSPETFSYVVEDEGMGEIHSGANVPLSFGLTGTLPPGAPPSNATAMSFGTPRQDTGLRVTTRLRKQGDNVLLDVNFELSAADARSTPGPVTIRKFHANGKALVAPGKTATVVTLDEPQKHYDLAVTATSVP